MSEYLIQDTTLTGIADAIRGKTGGTGPVAVSDMAAQIEGIEAGGGDIDAMIDRSITEISSNATKVGSYAFYDCTKLKTANFPMATSIGSYALYFCPITTINLPVVTSINNYAFSQTNLKTANFPMVTSIGTGAFSGALITTVNLPVVTSIGSYVFQGCSRLTTLILRSETIATLGNTATFSNTPIASGTGYIYVPRALLSDTDATKDYRRATNWSTFAAQFRALEDYTVDGTVTGELDETKI